MNKAILLPATILFFFSISTKSFPNDMEDCGYTGIKASISRSLNSKKYWNKKVKERSESRNYLVAMYRSEKLEIDKLRMTKQIRLKQAALDAIGITPQKAAEMEMENIRQEYEDSVSLLNELSKQIKHIDECINIAKKEMSRTIE